MPIRFVCPHCAVKTIVDDQYSGRTGPCAECGKSITVPFAAAAGPGSVVAAPAAPTKNIGVVLLLIGASLLAAVIVVGLIVVIVFPLGSAARTVALSQSCNANLLEIGDALHQYHQDHGCYPPPYIPDAAGKPMHSWRVLILPYLGERSLYEMYDFNQPWDSIENSKLIAMMPRVYGCLADPTSLAMGETNYQVVVGPQTLFPGTREVQLGDVIDGTDLTIAVVEVYTGGVSWSEPVDIDASMAMLTINAGTKNEIGSAHENGAHVLMADGRVVFLYDDTPVDFIQAMLSIDGNEDVSLEMLEDY